MESQFVRTELLLGKQALEVLAKARVAVFGLGGVGGAAAEALARAGVGALDLIDNDTVALSNLNRQLIATHETLGLAKTEAAAARVRAINPSCTVRTHALFYLPETADAIDLSAFDYLVDAVDTVSAKLCLAERARDAGVPLISCMGTGNKLDPTAFRVCDLFKTSGDPLARVMRSACRKRGIRKLKVVWSPEEPLQPFGTSAQTPAQGKRSVPGSVSFVPPVAGFILAGEAVKDLIALSKKASV